MTTYKYTQTDVIQESALSWFVWSLGCLFYFYEFLLQVSPGVMKAELSQSFNITAQSFGMVGGVYFYSYAFMQMPAGVLLDKLGPHKLLTLATLICAVSTLAFARTESFTTLLIARFCIGFGSAFAVVGTMKFAANRFSQRRFALLTGLMVAIGMAGAIGGEKPLAMMINHFGWRESLNYLGLSGLLLAALIFAFAKDSTAPGFVKPPEVTLSERLKDIYHSLKRVVRNPQLWLVASYGGLVYMSTPVFCGLWGVPFLKAKYAVDTELAATLTSLVFVGWIVGSPTWGLISDKIGQRKPPMIYGSIGAFIFISIVLYAPLPNHTLVGLALFLFGFFSSGFLPAFSIAKEISCNRNCATAMSFMNMMNMVGVAIAQPLIGYLLDKMWLAHHQAQGVANAANISHRVYDASFYNVAVSILPLGILVAMMILPMIKETYCHPAES